MSLLGRVITGVGANAFNQTTVGETMPETLFGSPATASGQTVTIDSGFKLVPVFAAVGLIAGTVGSLPLMVYRKGLNGRERAENHRTWPLLHDTPNAEMAADEVWELVTAHLCLWGNAFLAKIRDSQGMVQELWPIRPSRMTVARMEDGTRVFVLDGDTEDVYTEEDILHIRALGTDGVVGLSPIQQAREMIGGAKAIEQFTSAFWGNSAAPGGVLQHPNRLSEDAAERLKRQWKSSHGGPRKAGEVAVLEEGMTWQTTGMPLQDAQFIETQKFTDLRVAQLFGLPPYMIGADQGSSRTYTNTELQGLHFITYSLRRWLVRVESALLRDPSIFLQGSRIYPEFLLDGLLRADSASRAAFYTAALNKDTGWMARGEVRAAENLPADTQGEPPSGNDPTSS